MNLTVICDWIVLIGAVTIAITNIYNFFAKPTARYKNKRKDETKDQIKEVLEEVLPQILLDHDLETRKKYLSDRQRYLEEIRDEVLSKTKEPFKELQETNVGQNELIQILVQTSKNVLRQRIMSIYYEYKKERRIPMYQREILDELYKDYKAEGGNSYIDKYYNRMKSWETYDEYEEEIE